MFATIHLGRKENGKKNREKRQKSEEEHEVFFLVSFVSAHEYRRKQVVSTFSYKFSCSNGEEETTLQMGFLSILSQFGYLHV